MTWHNVKNDVKTYFGKVTQKNCFMTSFFTLNDVICCKYCHSCIVLVTCFHYRCYSIWYPKFEVNVILKVNFERTYLRTYRPRILDVNIKVVALSKVNIPALTASFYVFSFLRCSALLDFHLEVNIDLGL